MQLRTLIIEDEEPARNLVKNYLQNHPYIHLIGEYADGFTGVRAINEIQPDLIFLDIQMPKLTGFEVLELIEHKPIVIFTTAYDQFAIKAFEMNATDYLLKPFTRERFAQAVYKAVEKFEKKLSDENKIAAIIKSTEEKNEIIDRIAVKTGTKIHVIPVENINYLEADGDYVMIHTNEHKVLKEKTMKYFESHLDHNQFIRIHRSYIANVNQIDRLEQFDKENYVVVLKNKTVLKTSGSGYKLLKDKLNI